MPVILFIIFLIISLILIFLLTIAKVPKQKNIQYSKNKIFIHCLIYIILSLFIAFFYSFNPMSEDLLLGTIVNPYVASISIILQFINIVVFCDLSCKIIMERLNKKTTLFSLNLLYNVLIICSNIILYLGYNGHDNIIISSNIKIISKLTTIILYLPYIIYNLNLIYSLIEIKKGSREQ